MIQIRGWKYLRPVAFAAVLSALWLGAISPLPEALHHFQVDFMATKPVDVQIYYNRGAGLRESESSIRKVHPTGKFTTVQLPLPPGKYRSFYFDPTRSEHSARFKNLQIVTFDGRTVRRFSDQDFPPRPSRASAPSPSNARGMASPNEDLTPSVVFEPVLRLAFGFWSKVSLYWPRTLKAFLLSLTAVMLGQTLWRRRDQLHTRIRNFIREHPRGGLAVCAVIAAMASSYPVVFFGKSFVSPTSGVRLLYQDSPTLPEYTDLSIEDTRGADVGAISWAHQPYTVIQNRALFHEFTLPLWNRFNSCGVSLLGQGQSMFGDPLHFLVTAVGGNAWALDVKYVLCKALFGLGLGWCVWLLTRDFAASVIVVFAGTFMAFFNYRVNHPAIFSVSYSPWILAAWLEMILAKSSRSLAKALALWFVAGWCLLTSGTVKEAYLLFGSLNVTGAIGFLLCSRELKWKVRRAWPILFAIVAFCLATAPFWWTFLDALRAGKTVYDTPQLLQNPRGWLVGLFDDLFYLEVHPGRPVFTPAANFLVLLGCLWAVAQLRWVILNRLALAVLLGLLAAIGAAFAWLPAAWFLQLPFLRNVHQANNHFSCIAIVHAGVLAGCGFAAARGALVSNRVRRSVAIMSVLLAAILLAYFANRPALWTDGRGFAGWRDLADDHGFLYANVLLLPLALAWLTFATARRLKEGRMTVVTLAISAVAVFILLGRHGQHLAPSIPTDHVITSPGTRPDLLVPSPATDFLRTQTSQDPARVMGTGDTLFPGFMSVYGLEGINGPDAIFNGYHRELLDASSLTFSMGWRFSLVPETAAKSQPLLDFFNVRYIATPVGTAMAGERYDRVASLDLELYRSQTTWPRAFFTDRLESYGSAPDLVTLLSKKPDGRPFAAVQKGDTSAPSPSATNEDPVVIAATNFELTNNSTAFTVSASGPGFVILHESWMPDDFRATVDGASVPYFRVNHAFKGIAVAGPGTYRVEFCYWPRHLTISLILCSVGLMGFVTLIVVVRRGHLSGADSASDQQTAA